MLVKSLTASHVTIVETTDSGERGMNPVVFTIINTRKECWPSWGSNHRTLVLNPFPYKPWLLRVCSTSLLKTLWGKEKLLVTSNFSFSHSIFYSFENFLSPRQIQHCRLQTLSVWKSLKFVVWERVMSCELPTELWRLWGKECKRGLVFSSHSRNVLSLIL